MKKLEETTIWILRGEVLREYVPMTYDVKLSYSKVCALLTRARVAIQSFRRRLAVNRLSYQPQACLRDCDKNQAHGPCPSPMDRNNLHIYSDNKIHAAVSGGICRQKSCCRIADKNQNEAGRKKMESDGLLSVALWFFETAN